MLIAALGVQLACGGDDNTVAPSTPALVQVTAPSASCSAGASLQASATVKDASGRTVTGVGVSWSSNAEAVATVDGTGLITCVAPGDVIITAAAGSVAGHLDVSITPPAVTTVSVTPQGPPALSAGGTLQLSAVTDPAGRDVTWSTSDENIATVSLAGLVTATGPGFATISATSEGVVGTTVVTVSPAPVQLAIGNTIGAVTFANGDTPQGGQGAPIGQISCLGEQIAFHIHPHVSLFVDGQQVALPYAIGVVNPVVTGTANGPLVTGGSCWYWIHTHDASGIVHVEAPTQTTLRLGDLFDVWGMPLTATNLAGHAGQVTVWVDGVRFTGDPRAVAFANHQHITLEVGTPLAPPPRYLFPSGW